MSERLVWPSKVPLPDNPSNQELARIIAVLQRDEYARSHAFTAWARRNADWILSDDGTARCARARALLDAEWTRKCEAAAERLAAEQANREGKVQP